MCLPYLNTKVWELVRVSIMATPDTAWHGGQAGADVKENLKNWAKAQEAELAEEPYISSWSQWVFWYGKSMSNPQKFGQVIVLIRSLLMFVFLYVENPRPNFCQHVCCPLEIGCESVSRTKCIDLGQNVRPSHFDYQGTVHPLLGLMMKPGGLSMLEGPRSMLEGPRFCCSTKFHWSIHVFLLT